MTLLQWRQKTTTVPQAESFSSLALPLLANLHSLALWLTRNTAEAEDLVQETLLKALKGFAGYEPGTNFKAWIFRILRNTFLTSRTGLSAVRFLALDEENSSATLFEISEATTDRSTPELDLIRMSDSRLLRNVIDELTPQLKEVLLLVDFEELKYRDVAIVLDLPIGTVMSRLARARAAVRRNFEKIQPREFPSPHSQSKSPHSNSPQGGPLND